MKSAIQRFVSATGRRRELWSKASGRCKSSDASVQHGTVALELAEIKELTEKALAQAGASPEHADAVADVVMRAEQDGSVSHGLFRVPGYVAALTSGKVQGNPNPKVQWVTPSLLRCDGDRSFAPLAHRRRFRDPSLYFLYPWLPP